MSDFAPFVSATLRDRKVAELKNKNDELRAAIVMAEEDGGYNNPGGSSFPPSTDSNVCHGSNNDAQSFLGCDKVNTNTNMSKNTNSSLNIIVDDDKGNLAASVAAALKGKVEWELKEENTELRELIDTKLLSVRVMGPIGGPIYFEGSLKDGQTSRSGNVWKMNVGNTNDDTAATNNGNGGGGGVLLPTGLIKCLEIQLGGRKLPAVDLLTSDGWDIDTGIGRLVLRIFRSSPVVRDLCSLHARIGPIPRDEFYEIIARQGTGLGPGDVRFRELVIDGLHIAKSNILGRISLIEKIN